MNRLGEFWIMARVELDVCMPQLTAYDREPFLGSACRNQMLVLDKHLNIVDGSVRDGVGDSMLLADADVYCRAGNLKSVGVLVGRFGWSGLVEASLDGCKVALHELRIECRLLLVDWLPPVHEHRFLNVFGRETCKRCGVSRVEAVTHYKGYDDVITVLIGIDIIPGRLPRRGEVVGEMRLQLLEVRIEPPVNQRLLICLVTCLLMVGLCDEFLVSRLYDLSAKEGLVLDVLKDLCLDEL